MQDDLTLPFDEPEQWVPVAHYVGLYDVSDLGNVRSHYSRPPKLMRPVPAGPDDPHLRVTLTRNGIGETVPVAHLVAEAFIGPRPEGQVVRHGPLGQAENRRSNISYGTQGDNMLDKRRDGTMPHGERHNQAVLTDAIVSECRLRCAAGEKQTALAREFGVSQVAMWRAVTGQTWTHIDVPVIPMETGRIRADQKVKLNPEMVREIRERHAAGVSGRALAMEFGVSAATVSHVVNRKIWKDVA